MRPVDIPDHRRWADDHGQLVERRTLGAPHGAEREVRPVEVLVEERTLAGHTTLQYHLLLQLQAGDLEALAADPHCWLTFWGAVVPFCITVPGASERQLLGYRARINGADVLLNPADVDPVYQTPPEEANHHG